MDNNNIARMPTVYIGFDKREELYYNVLKYSITNYILILLHIEIRLLSNIIKSKLEIKK